MWFIKNFYLKTISRLILIIIFIGTIWIYIYTMKEKLKATGEKNLKSILYWNQFFSSSDYLFGFGHEPFKKRCRIKNCYSSINRKNVEKYDAVLIHGPLFQGGRIPKTRSPEQHYVMLNHENPKKFRDSKQLNLKNFINLTITYRLDSDIFVPYFKIFDTQDKYVAPMFKPNWIEPIHNETYLKEFIDLYDRKSKPIAWFVSNCRVVFNSRNKYVKELQKYIPVDIYGKCGTLECPKIGSQSCNEQLKNYYFFYISFENANCVDYVTEKFLTPLMNDVVPIVMNGADMNRFSPPYAYINARKYSPKKLADYLKFLMSNPFEYLKYHWWRKTYTASFVENTEDSICSLCEFLNSNKSNKYRSYDDYRLWRAGSKGNEICSNR